jgi:hypothetical protein
VEAPAGLNPPLLYLYGFVPLPFDMPKIPGVDADTDVFLLACEDFGCAASVVDAGEYQPEEPRGAAEQLAWVAPRACRHHEVLRTLHAATTVIPLKFGTLCAGIDQARAILSGRRAAIADLVARFEGKDEWTLAMSVDEASIGAVLQRTSAELQALDSDARRLPGGHAYFARKRLQKATADLVARAVADVERDVSERLDGLLLDVSPFARESRANDGRLTAAALVSRDRFAAFEAALADLEAHHGAARLTFELGGPWPPYTFASAIV